MKIKESFAVISNGKLWQKIFIGFAVVALIAVGIFVDNKPAKASLYGPGDMLISEFTVTGTPWIELLNTTGSDINLASSTWLIVVDTQGPAYHSTTTLSSGIIPAKGLLTVPVINNILPNGLGGISTMIRVLNFATTINAVSYGGGGQFGTEPHVNGEPGPGQSIAMTGTSSPAWNVTSSVSQGWFNETVNSMDCNNPPVPGVGQPPSLAAIVACIPGITTNMANTSSIPDPTHATSLYFSTSTNGKIDYGATALNLTDQNTRALLETLGDNMKIDGGKIGLDASSSALMRNPTNNITISFYNMKSRGYENMDTTSIRVKDDSGNYIPTSSPNFPSLAGMSWNPGTNGGTFSFGSNHFSEYDINPTVVEVTPVPTPATNTSPSYTFGTNVTGTAVFGGDCAMAAASTTNGNNTVVFGPLGVGTYSNCTVKVIDSFGASTTLNVSSFTINSSNPPGTITGLLATPASQNQINLSWTATSSATYYKLYGGANSTSLPFIASTTGATYNNTGLATGTLYYYKISGVNGNGEGASSTAVSTTTLDIPATPTGLALTPVSQTQINLSWNSVSGASYYNIYRGDFMVQPLVASTTNPNFYNNTGLATNTNYWYHITAVNIVGESGPSSAANTSTFPITPPAAPTGVTIIPTSTSVILLSWNATTNTDYYKINHALSPLMYVIVATTSGLTYSHGSLGINTAHYYKITAVNGGGQTDSSDFGPYYTFAAVPAGLAATASTTNSVSLQWGDNGNPDGTVYHIYGSGFTTVSTTATSTSISSLTPNSSYTFNVVSLNGSDVSSSPVSVSDWTKSADVVSVNTIPSVNSVDLSWNANSNPGGTVYQVSGAGFSTVTTTATGITIGSLTANTSYTFNIQSQNHDGSFNSAVTTTVSTLTIPPPNAPINASTYPSSTNSILITWSAPATNTPDYYVVYHMNTSTYVYEAVVTTTGFQYTHGGLTPNSFNTYKVSSVNSGGETTTTDSYGCNTLANPPTSAAIISSSTNSFVVHWNANGNPDDTQYHVYYNGTEYSGVVSTTQTVSGLTANTSYQIVVKSQNGSQGIRSASSSPVTDWTKPRDPQSLVLTASTSNSLTFSWSANGNPAGTYYNLNNAGFGSIYTTSTTYTVSPLPSATTYTTITIRAVSHEYPSQSYTSGGDTLASASTQANDPASLVTTASTTNSVSLQWNANGNAGGTVYQISGVGFATVTTTNVTTTIGSLSPNTGYTFTVKAQNPDSSYTSGVTITDWTKANNPSGPDTLTSITSINLAWNANGNAGGTVYQISGAFSASPVTTSATTTVINSLTPNTSYTFTIKAQNHDGSYTSGVSSVADYTKAAVPGTPTAAASGATSIDLSWSANSNPGTTVYYIYGGPSTVTTTAVTATITGLATSTSYQFAVKAKDIGDANYSALSASSTAVSTWGLPAVTTLAASSVASTSASLNGNITSMGGEASIIDRGFNVGTTTSYFNNFSEGPGFFGTGSFNHTWSILTPGTVYHYQARAQNSVGLATGSDMMFISTFVPTVGNPTSTITGAYSVTSTVAVPSSVINATVDLSSLTSSNSTTLPGALQVSADTTLGTIQVSIPAGTKITADDTWNGTLVLPTVKDNSSVTVTADSGKTATVDEVIEIGFGDVALTLDKAARILIPGKTGKDAGYYRDGTFTKITATCTDDTQATNNGLAPGADCKINVGSDLVIWTKHFTSFVVYTQTNQTTGGSSSSGGTTPPQNVSVAINSGATSTATTAVTLTLTATGAAQMMISNYSDFSVGAWESYATTKSWTLISGVGTKTVYVKFRDASYTTSNAVSDTITLVSSTAAEPPVAGPSCPTLVSGNMVKVTGKPAIYSLNKDLEVMYFPSGDEFKSWRPTYGGYISINQACFDSLKVPSRYPAAVNYHPGSYIVKRPSSDQLYVVEPNNTLAKITPALATVLYGTGYKVMTVSDVFWPHYINRGPDIVSATPHPGMLVKVNNVTYYVDMDNKLNEVTTAGFTANGFQQKFVRTVPSSSVSSLAIGEKIETETAILVDKVQGE